jgi:hypothetical protein
MKRRLAALALSLSLPAAAPLDAQPSPDQSVRAYLQARFEDARGVDAPARYSLAFADLNGDARAEAIVWLAAGPYCGSGGCTLVVLTPRGRSWRTVSTTSVTSLPITLLATRSHGWRDLSAFAVGGGITHGYGARVRFHGRGYGDTPEGPVGRSGRVLIPSNDRSRPLF